MMTSTATPTPGAAESALDETPARGGGGRPPRWTDTHVTVEMRGKLHRRHVINGIMVGLVSLAALIATLPLIFILFHLIDLGGSSVQWHFFTNMPKPVGESGGGMANAIVGTIILVAAASVIGLPVGIGAGLYLAEHSATRLANITRFLADVLNGLPSIVMGIFAWQFLVRPIGHFSAWAGSVALAAMMIPQVARTTEEIVRTVPVSLREAALALGYARWRTSLSIVLRTASAGVVTGALVAIARIAGETAPLLFTAFGNQFWSTSLNQPIAALPLQIFTYAVSPYDDWHAQAWAGALVLISMILIISLVARVATRRRFAGTGGD
jgi:phosphate transport system permease protein